MRHLITHSPKRTMPGITHGAISKMFMSPSFATALGLLVVVQRLGDFGP